MQPIRPKSATLVAIPARGKGNRTSHLNDDLDLKPKTLQSYIEETEWHRLAGKRIKVVKSTAMDMKNGGIALPIDFVLDALTM